MGTFRRGVWLLLPIVVTGVSLALTASSEEIRAGIVTGLQGSAKVMRASLSQPRALNFKDHVYLHDEIVTGEASLARILLGGKALLTVRERSVVRITEAPGRSTVAVTRGRAAVNVLKERMRPGDTVEMRTPNATAAIRGTIVVAEVETDGAETRSTITVLRGLIDVTRHDAAGRPFGQAVSVAALQQVRIAGSWLSPVQRIAPQSAGRLANDFKMNLRAVPAPAAAVQAQVDHAVQVLAREAGGNRDAADDKSDGKGGDARNGDGKSADAKDADAKSGDAKAGEDGKTVDKGADVGKGGDTKGGDTKVTDSGKGAASDSKASDKTARSGAVVGDRGGDRGAGGSADRGGDRLAGGGGDRADDRLGGGGYRGDRRGGKNKK
jgi:hypothetical protein